MATTTRTTNLASGFQATHFIGCDLDEGKAVPATADTIKKAWGPTEQAALGNL